MEFGVALILGINPKAIEEELEKKEFSPLIPVRRGTEKKRTFRWVIRPPEGSEKSILY